MNAILLANTQRYWTLSRHFRGHDSEGITFEEALATIRRIIHSVPSDSKVLRLTQGLAEASIICDTPADAIAEGE